MRENWETLTIEVRARYAPFDKIGVVTPAIVKTKFDSMTDEELGRWLRNKLNDRLARLELRAPKGA